MSLSPALLGRLRARHLALVVALDTHRSLRRAAAEIALTQPAATKLLHDLEDALGAPLFERHAWGMSPTPYGDTLVRHARGMLNDLAQAQSDIAAQRAGALGSLRVGGRDRVGAAVHRAGDRRAAGREPARAPSTRWSTRARCSSTRCGAASSTSR
jgi:DNA-binding transcriptional LysR family regulator